MASIFYKHYAVIPPPPTARPTPSSAFGHAGLLHGGVQLRDRGPLRQVRQLQHHLGRVERTGQDYHGQGDLQNAEVEAQLTSTINAY